MFYLGLVSGILLSLMATGLGYLIGVRITQSQVAEPLTPSQPLPKRTFFTRGPTKRKPKVQDDATAWKVEQLERDG